MNFDELREVELLSWGFERSLHPEDRDRLLEARQQAISQNQPYQITYRLQAFDGSYNSFLEQALPVNDNWVVSCTQQYELSAREQAAQIEAEANKKSHYDSLEALQQSEERYRSLVIATSQIVWTTDAQGQVVDMPHWRNYTGQSQAEVKGWGWLAAVHPEDRERTATVWTEAVQTQSLYDTEYRIRATDNSYRYFAVRGVPVIATDGTIREWVGVCTDIQERKTAEAALTSRANELAYLTAILTQTNAVLEKRNQELDQFAYVTSHDLKAPLRAIANLSQWIEEDIGDVLTEETRHQMGLLRGRVHRMDALINGLLQFSRSGRVTTDKSSVFVADLLAEIVDSLAPPPSFIVEIAPNMPTLVTERLPLEQVFSNLIGNAIKHHPRPDGKVQISVIDRGLSYEFAVSDNGKGIAPEYHEKIFGIFQTLEARDRNENTGIGLAIVKKIVENYGGLIKIDSLEGQGARFSFTWHK